MNQKDNHYLFDHPGHYRIFVQGQLSTNWSSRLSGMEITVKESANQQPVTILSGELRDQAALLGVLNTLYDMRCPIIKVEQLDAGPLVDNPQTDEARPSE